MATSAPLDWGPRGDVVLAPYPEERPVTYDAVGAYTVLFGDGDEPATVSVHGSAREAWDALSLLVEPGRRRRSAWHGRSGRGVGRRPADEDAVRAAAERWRLADPDRRFWQVAPHRLQVTVPAIAGGRVTPRPT